MKKAFVGIIAALVALSFAGVARAIPANSNMNQAIDVLENQDQGSKPAKKPAKKPATAKKPRKQGKVKAKKTAPAASETPATPSGQPKEK